MRGLGRKLHILKSFKLHFAETMFQLTSGFTKLEVFENPCGAYADSAIYSTQKKQYGETIFELISCFTESCLQTNTGLMQTVPYTLLCQTTLLENDTSTNL